MGRDEDLKLIPIAELTVNNISRKGKLIILRRKVKGVVVTSKPT